MRPGAPIATLAVGVDVRAEAATEDQLAAAADLMLSWIWADPPWSNYSTRILWTPAARVATVAEASAVESTATVFDHRRGHVVYDAGTGYCC